VGRGVTRAKEPLPALLRSTRQFLLSDRKLEAEGRKSASSDGLKRLPQDARTARGRHELRPQIQNNTPGGTLVPGAIYLTDTPARSRKPRKIVVAVLTPFSALLLCSLAAGQKAAILCQKLPRGAAAIKD
jgi:hypothetical protein